MLPVMRVGFPVNIDKCFLNIRFKRSINSYPMPRFLPCSLMCFYPMKSVFSLSFRTTMARVKNPCPKPIPILKILKICLILFSITGFVFQTSGVARTYFSYATTTHLHRELRSMVKPPVLTVCMRYFDLMDFEKLHRETQISFQGPDSLDSAMHLEAKLTVAQILNYTRDVKPIPSCAFRNENGEFMVNWDDVCDNKFRVVRFMKQEHVCFSYEMVNRSDIQLYEVTRSSFGPNLIYALSLPDLTFSQHVELVLHDTLYPYDSRDYSSYMDDYTYADDRFAFDVWSTRRTYHFLQPPYHPNCRSDASPEDRFHCMRHCLMHSFTPLGRVPCSEILLYPYDLPCLGSIDRRNASVMKIYRNSHKTCRANCNLQSCERKYFVTSHQTLRRFNYSADYFRILPPHDSDITVIYMASMDFCQFFSFFCGCFGCWFGVSFLSTNRLLLLFSQRNDKRSRVASVNE